MSLKPVVRRQITSITPIIEENTVTAPKKKNRTVKQINTIRIIHERVAYYDILLKNYSSEPTAENKAVLDDYSTHLRNVLQLATYVYDYIEQNRYDDTLLSYSKIRKVITEEIDVGTLIRIDGLIRNPKTNPYENISSTGNVIPIILPQEHIDKLKSYLTERLINETVRILVPCNNMILIVETGDHTGHVNEDLKRKIFQAIMLYAPDNGLNLPIAFEPEGIVKYILE